MLSASSYFSCSSSSSKLEGGCSTTGDSSSILTAGLFVDGFMEDAQSGLDEDQGAAKGAELVNLLVACANAVAHRCSSSIHRFIARLGQIASPDGESPMERLAAYFTEALACRAALDRPDVYRPLPLPTHVADDEAAAAFHVLNHVSPMVKFAHFSANEVILRAFSGHDRVHVIDLDVSQGLQWPALFQALASRPGGPPSHFRLSGVGAVRDAVEETGERLAEFATSLGMAFEFHAVIDRLDDVRLWMLHVKDGEAVAVNSVCQLHRSLHDRERIRAVLELIRSTRPVVVTVIEQEASHNAAAFASRFPACLRYYAALFDSLDASKLPSHSPARAKVERSIFAREIRNIVACDGEDFVERHESFSSWATLFRDCGFRNFGMSPAALVQARILLEMFACKDYRLIEAKCDEFDAGCGGNASGITLAWLDQPLLTASAWSI